MENIKNEIKNSESSLGNTSEEIRNNNLRIPSPDLEYLDDFDSKESSENFKTYIVGRYGSGEKYTTLWEIAKDAGVSIEDIKKANPNIREDNIIYPGQEIVVPIKNKVASSPQAKTEKESLQRNESKESSNNTSQNSEENQTPPQSNTSSDLRKYGNDGTVRRSNKSNNTIEIKVTTDNPKHSMSESEMIEVAAVMYAEAVEGSWDDALGVASVLANRADRDNCSMQSVAQAPGQFHGYGASKYYSFKNAYANGTMNEGMKICLSALQDCANGVRNNNGYYFAGHGSYSTYRDNY